MRNAYAVRRPVVNPYLVRVRDRRRHRQLAVVLAFAVAVGLCLLGYVWMHVELLHSGYRIHGLEGRLEELQRTERLLQLEARYLSSPDRIERRAIEELGMRPPELEQVVFEKEIR